jgi:hypothetical protein
VGPVPDFWNSCGYRLLTVGGDGRLTLTDDFLRSFLLRPELAPLPDSGGGEHALHDELMAHPRMAVDPSLLAAVEDDDARDNYAIWLRFRGRLAASPSIEAAYVALFEGEGVDVPPLFVHQLTQILLRHILGIDADPFEARAAEMLFRPQTIAVLDDGSVMAADVENVERYSTASSLGSLGELLARNQTPLRSVDLDVLHEGNAEAYWDRDERFDLAVSLNRGSAAIQALSRVLERWVRHFLAIEVRIGAIPEIERERWSWHVGLDAEASSMLNDLYNGVEVDGERLHRLLSLFKLEFADPAAAKPGVRGRPVWLAMAMDASGRMKLKPQNLLINLPLARQ